MSCLGQQQLLVQLLLAQLPAQLPQLHQMSQCQPSLLHPVAALLSLRVEQSEFELQPSPEVETLLLSLSYAVAQNQSSGLHAWHQVAF